MTLDEAIKRFSDNAEYERSHGSLQGCLEFRQLAEWLTELKKLKEQTEPCGKDINVTTTDAISRQAAIDAIHYYCKNICGLSDYNWCPDCQSEQFVGSLKDLPSVQPEPKKGNISIADVMSVFDDFMCGDVDEDGTETFLEMLKDKAESEDGE